MIRPLVFALALGLCATVVWADPYSDCCQHKDVDRSIRACTSIIERGKRESRKNRFDAYYCRGITYGKKHKSDRAIADYTKAIEINPESAKSYQGRGISYGAKGESDRAIADLTKVIGLKPKDAAAYTDRGAAYAMKGDKEKGIADVRKALELDPSYQNAKTLLKLLGQLPRDDQYSDCNQTNDLHRTIRGCTQIIERGTQEPWENSARAYYNRGNAYRGKTEFDHAIADYDKAIAINPNYAVAYNNRGLTYEIKGEFDRAIADYTEAIRLNRKFPQAYNGRGITYGKIGDYDRAIADFDRAIKLNPKYAIAYNNRGITYEKKGDKEQAIADLRKALEIDPSLQEAEDALEDLGVTP